MIGKECDIFFSSICFITSCSNSYLQNFHLNILLDVLQLIAIFSKTHPLEICHALLVTTNAHFNYHRNVLINHINNIVSILDS